MPEEDQKDTTTHEVEEAEQPEELSTSKESKEQEEQQEELPENVKDRTREQFEKLKASNAELKKQLEENKKLPSVLDYLNSPVPNVAEEVRQKYNVQPQAETQETPEEQLVDEQGYINADALQKQLKAIQEVQRQAQEAERRAKEAQERIARYEQDEETKKLYQSYPELDPLNENFNKDAYDLVKNELTSQIVQTGSRDALRAAEKMSKFFRKGPDKSQVQQQREQAVSAGTTSHQGQSNDDFEALRRASRNDPNAVAERLRRLGI